MRVPIGLKNVHRPRERKDHLRPLSTPGATRGTSIFNPFEIFKLNPAPAPIVIGHNFFRMFAQPGQGGVFLLAQSLFSGSFSPDSLDLKVFSGSWGSFIAARSEKYFICFRACLISSSFPHSDCSRKYSCFHLSNSSFGLPPDLNSIFLFPFLQIAPAFRSRFHLLDYGFQRVRILFLQARFRVDHVHWGAVFQNRRQISQGIHKVVV